MMIRIYGRFPGRSRSLCKRGVCWHACRVPVACLTLALLSLPALLAAADVPAMADSARAQIHALQQEKARRTPAQHKLSSRLIYAARQRRGQPPAPGVTSLDPMVRYEADGRVLVDIGSDVTPAVLAAIAQAGGTVVTRVPRYQAIRALLPVEQAEALAGRGDIRYIRPAAQATTLTGSVTSQGDATHLAALARSTYNVDGTGIKIGVLSDSVDYLATLQASGDLGAVTVLPGQGGTGYGYTGEGTAMLEIVHDLAPAAQLYFATAFSSEAGFAQNILDLQAAGCDIIVDDVAYFDEPAFQDGIVAQAVSSVTAAGALYFSAAGNSGSKDHGTSGTWEGDFADGGAATAPLAGPGRLHNFGGGITNNTVVSGGNSRRADLFWSDPQGASSNDYDLYVLNSTGTSVLRLSDGSQNGTQDPYEAVDTLNIGERIVIVQYSGVSRYLHLEAGRGRLSINTSGSTRGHNAVASAITVAAVSAVVNAYPGAFSGGAANPVESFSSDGLRRIFYHPNGTAITPGNLSSTGGRLLQKPDLAAADGASSALPGFNPFYGTSSAAPHAAAIAGLVWSYDHLLPAATVLYALTNTALDIEAAGVDRDSGVGIVMALPAVRCVVSNSPPVFVAARLRETIGNGNAAPNPGETIGEWIVWTNRGTVARTGITATLAAPAPGITILQGSSSYPDMPARSSASNAVPFSYRLAKNIPAGTVLSFTNILSCGSLAGTATFTRVVGSGIFNMAPVASNQSVTVSVGSSSNLVLRGSDPDNDPALTFRVVGTPAHGTLQGLDTNSGAVTYLADSNYAGPDSFTFVVNDSYTDSAPATVSVSAVSVTTNTLTVISERGGVTPGTVSADTYSSVSEWITNSPVVNGATQYICTGGAVAGNAYAPASPTHVTLTLTNDATLTWSWQTQYLLTTATNGPGSVTAGGWCISGSNVSLVATPGAHAHAAGWSGDTSGCLIAGSTLAAPMTQARAITALFAIDTQTLSVTSANGGASPGSLTTNWGTPLSQWITNSPVVNGATQYVCTGGAVAGNAYAPASPTHVTLTLTNDATLAWSWQTQYLLTTATNGPGSVTAGGWCISGSNVTLTATPGAHAHAAGWSGDTSGCLIAGSTLAAPMTQARAITALFAIDTQTLSVTSASGGASPGSLTTNWGTPLSQWITNSPVVNGTTQYICTGGAVAGNAYAPASPTHVTLTLTNDATLIWSWQTQYLLTTATNGLGSVTAGGWQIAGSNVSLVATPGAHAHATGWSGDTSGCFIAGNTLTAPMTQARAVTALFAFDTQTLSVTSANGGASPGSLTTNWGTPLSQWVTNSPVVNGTTQYICTGGAVAGNAYAPASPTHVTLTLTNDATLTWSWQTQYLLTTATNGPGSVTAGGWRISGSNVSLVATPTASSHIVQWSGDTSGCLAAFTTLTVPVTRPRVITAVFAAGATPVISGTITRSDTKAVLSGVRIAFANVPGEAVSDSSGNYTKNVPYGWSGTATASFGSGGFAKPALTYKNLTSAKAKQNFVWSPDPVISGTVTRSDTKAGVPGVTLAAGNSASDTTTDSSGNYVLTVPYNWTGALVPTTPAGGTFKKPSIAYSNLTKSKAKQNFVWLVPAVSAAAVPVPAGVSGATAGGGFARWALERGLAGNPVDLFAQDADGDGIANGAEYAFGANLAEGEPLLRLLVFNGRLTAELPIQDPATLPDVRETVEYTADKRSGRWSPATGLSPLAPAPATKQWFQAGSGDAADFRVNVQRVP
ncbi:MAG: Ig-like domain-containing protein [bacterium]